MGAEAAIMKFNIDDLAIPFHAIDDLIERKISLPEVIEKRGGDFVLAAFFIMVFYAAKDRAMALNMSQQEFIGWIDRLALESKTIGREMYEGDIARSGQRAVKKKTRKKKKAALKTAKIIHFRNRKDGPLSQAVRELARRNKTNNPGDDEPPLAA